MKISELFNNPVVDELEEVLTDKHLSRAYDLDAVSAMLPNGTIKSLRTYHDAAELPIGSIVLSAELHGDTDVSKVSYLMYKKVKDDTDTMSNSFEDLGALTVSPYAKSTEVASAFSITAKQLL